MGLKTLPRRVITAPGVKPIGTVDWQFEASWLDGAVAPLTGDPFFLELPHADRACFQAFLDHFAHYDSNAIHVLQLDQARFHLAKRLYIPDNILLLLQPPHSPETNPIERLWQWIKDQLAWQNFPRLDDLKQRVAESIQELTPAVIKGWTGWSFILEALASVYP